MKNLMKTSLSAVILLALPVLSISADKSIYGSDDRLDYFEAPAAMQTLSDSVVSFWKSAKLTDVGGKYQLTTKPFKDAMGLCPGEKFEDQPLGAFCSGSLVGDDMVMTAGHCVKTAADCADVRLVFGYKVGKPGAAATTTIAKSQVYGCSKIVTRFLVGEPGSVAPAGQTLGPDYALIKLDRKVTGHKVLAIDRAQNLQAGDKIFVIGHPVGLPLKAAGTASIRDAGKIGYFVADLDTFGGNSGSPVFNASTNKIEGILVRGDTDFVKSPEGCTTMATYDQTGGRGEDVTKVSVISSYIPLLPGEKAEDEMIYMDTTHNQCIAPADATSVSFQ